MGATATKLREIDELLAAELAKYDGRCCFCGYEVEALRWHHVDPTTKKFEIGDLRSRGRLDLIIDELPKCAPAGDRCHNNYHHQNASDVRCHA